MSYGEVLVTIGVVLLVIFSGFVVVSWETVQEHERAVEYVWGEQTETVHGPGGFFMMPIGHKLVREDVSPQVYTMSHTQGEGAESSRNDAVTFQANGTVPGRADITVQYRLKDDSESVRLFAQRWPEGREYFENEVIRSIVRSTVRDEAAGIDPEVIMSENGRELLAESIREDLGPELEEEHMILEAVRVRDVTITDQQYMNTLREVEQEKKNIQREEHRVSVERQLAEQERVKAEARADVIEIEGKALRENPEVIELRRIEAYESAGAIYVVSEGADGPTLIRNTTGSR